MALLTAKTTYGEVRGVPSAKNPSNTVFRGIPFAAPPVGTLRFAPPALPDPWEGERFCADFGSAPIQGKRHPGQTFPFETSEDCLYLNVYTLAKQPGENLPVLFWIFGGGFQNGSASDPEFDGNRFNDLGAILVTANYRCGALGFFALPELTNQNGFSGNVGLLDQIAALKWVRDNIESFGGDPTRVTIFGQSAGGMSVRMLLTSPITKGLFSRAIVESGGGLNEGDLVRTREDFTGICQRSAAHQGWSFQDLMSLDAQILADGLAGAAKEISTTEEFGYFQPFLDGYTLNEVPGKSIFEGDYPDIPIICGTVAGDAMMFCRKALKQVSGRIDYLRGFSFSPGEAWAQHQIESGRTPIYTYYLDRKQPAASNEGLTHGLPPFGGETRHGSEIGYVFGTLGVRNHGYTEYDYQLSDAVSRYWAAFAATGVPAVEGLPKWPLHTEEAPVTMHFGDAGFVAETILGTDGEKRVIDYTIAHPGMLETVEGL
ncbi:MAG: carboxylesterase family protein [Lachnospiraceae bacterium]|nr:carboxylesterase family protein [Lachnospiraceae bacterium]